MEHGNVGVGAPLDGNCSERSLRQCSVATRRPRWSRIRRRRVLVQSAKIGQRQRARARLLLGWSRNLGRERLLCQSCIVGGLGTGNCPVPVLVAVFLMGDLNQ